MNTALQSLHNFDIKPPHSSSTCTIYSNTISYPPFFHSLIAIFLKISNVTNRRTSNNNGTTGQDGIPASPSPSPSPEPPPYPTLPHQRHNHTKTIVILHPYSISTMSLISGSSTLCSDSRTYWLELTSMRWRTLSFRSCRKVAV